MNHGPLVMITKKCRIALFTDQYDQHRPILNTCVFLLQLHHIHTYLRPDHFPPHSGESWVSQVYLSELPLKSECPGYSFKAVLQPDLSILPFSHCNNITWRLHGAIYYIAPWKRHCCSHTDNQIAHWKRNCRSHSNNPIEQWMRFIHLTQGSTVMRSA